MALLFSGWLSTTRGASLYHAVFASLIMSFVVACIMVAPTIGYYN